MKELDFEDLCVWGLYVSRAWPVDIPLRFQPKRGRLVNRLIADAHRAAFVSSRDLGIYSWGLTKS